MLKKVSVVDVVLGMYIHELCGSWMDHPFWKAGFALHTLADLRSLQSSAVTEVWIDTIKGLDLPVDVAYEGLEGTAEHAETVLQEALVEPVDRVTMSDELQRAFEICERSKQAVMTMFSAVRMGQAIEMHGAAQIVEEMNQSILRHPSALLSLVRLKKS